MRTATCICMYLLILNVSFAQNKQFVDVAPYSVNCGSDLETVFHCTEDEVYKFMMQELDMEACPETDSVAFYNVSFTVDVKGNLNEANVTSYNGTEACLSYMTERAKLLGDQMKMEAAQLDGKHVEFNKKFSLIHPLDSIHAMTYESTGQFRTVEEMPRFTGCEGMEGSAKDKEMCAQYDMLMFIYKNLKYPNEARENGVEGTVVAQFMVDTTGHLKDLKIVREIGGGCGDAVLEVLDNMNNEYNNAPFVPGMQRGKAVKVQYTLPVRFRLEKNTLFKKKNKKKKK